MARKRSKWSYAAGRRGRRVIVYERDLGGNLWARTWDPTLRDGKGEMRRVSLGHADRDRAMAYADEQAAQLARGRSDLLAGRISWERLFRLYREHRTPLKGNAMQQTDERTSEMWERFLGSSNDPHKLRPADWQQFIPLRRCGAIDARGNPVALEDRRPVGDRTLEADLKWLLGVLNWGQNWRTGDGLPLLRENPAKGLPIPSEKNVRRPVASTDRYEGLLESIERAADAGDNRMVLLRDLFAVAAGTGRRLSAVCKLTYGDIDLDAKPYGAIRWPAHTDKIGKEWVTPITPNVRESINRVRRLRPGLGSAPLFPSPGDSGKPISRHLADKWLRAAEKAAGLVPQKGSLWHAYRRGWATARKHLPAVDVAAAGGWKNAVTVQKVYQQADQQTILQAVLGGQELREAR